MSGYPLYAPVHKGLRLALGNFSSHISKMNVEDQAKIDAFVKRVSMFAAHSFIPTPRMKIPKSSPS